MKLSKPSPYALLGITSVYASSNETATPPYAPCPLLGPAFPAPIINTSSPTLQAAFSQFDRYIDDYLAADTGDFGPTYPNTTSFSIALFGGESRLSSEDSPIIFEYHHGATTVAPNADTVYAVGELTQLFTVFALLAELGDGVWERKIVEYVPELLEANFSSVDPIRKTDWSEITLGALAGHMSGIARDSNACELTQACQRRQFVDAMRKKPPVFAPDTTPVFSHAAFQLLAYAIESACDRLFAAVLQDRILSPLRLNHTHLLDRSDRLLGLTNTSLKTEPASSWLVTTVSDLSRLGHSILTSSILSPATTRRWLKPFSSTSNLRNAVGRPWEIYHFSNEATDPIMDIFTKTGSLGRYSSYFGLVPDSQVGFAILAVNEAESAGQAPDLNAYADMMLGALLQINTLGRAEAQGRLAGTYISAATGDASSLTLNVTGSSDPGLAVTRLVVNGTDWLARIAGQNGIAPENVDMRFYPTNLERQTGSGGKRRAFRAVVQDKSAPVDEGTPTCVSWMTVDEQYRQGWSLDEIVLELDSTGHALSVEWPALRLTAKAVEER